jgi:hypothetical protein
MPGFSQNYAKLKICLFPRFGWISAARKTRVLANLITWLSLADKLVIMRPDPFSVLMNYSRGHPQKNPGLSFALWTRC